MELVSHNIPLEEVYIGAWGDSQWSGDNGPTAKEHLKAYLAEVTKLNGYLIGCGDYVDFMSPSNRQRLKHAGLYDTAAAVIEDAAKELTADFYTKFLKGTEGKWLGLVHGHHYFEYSEGGTTDTWLADKLQSPYLGTSALVTVKYGKKLQHKTVIFVHHGVGSGTLPSAGLNKLYHTAQSWEADLLLMGHNTKLACAVMSRQQVVYTGSSQDLVHKEMRIINTGGFSKSSTVGHTQGGISHGDYAEERMLGPAPLAAPIINLRPDGSVRVTI